MYHPELLYTEQAQPQDVLNDLSFFFREFTFSCDSQQEEKEDAAPGTDDGDFGIDDDGSGTDDDEDTLYELLVIVFYSTLAPYYVSWFPKITEILHDPSRIDTRRNLVCRKLARAIRKLEATRFWQRWMRLGCITECLDPAFFLGYRSGFSSFHIAQLAITVTLTEVVLLRTRYDLGLSGSAPDGDVYRRYLDACVRGWLCLPYLQT